MQAGFSQELRQPWGEFETRRRCEVSHPAEILAVLDSLVGGYTEES